MPAKKPGKNLVLDVGAGSAEFTRLLRKRNPKDKVVGIDRNPKSKADVKALFGSFFLHRLKEPEKVKSVWLNHVEFFSSQGFKEFKAMADRLQPGTPVILTVRKKYLATVNNTLDQAGLQVKKSVAWTPRMIGSPATKKFFQEAKAGFEEHQPIRIVALKPKER